MRVDLHELIHSPIELIPEETNYNSTYAPSGTRSSLVITSHWI